MDCGQIAISGSGRLRIAGALTLVMLTLGACGRQAESPPVAESAKQPIDEFFAEVFERRVAQSPVRQSQLGRDTDMLGNWDDVSDEFAMQRLDEARQDLARLRADYDPGQLTDAEQLSYELFEFNTERLIANAEFRRHSFASSHRCSY